VVQNLFDVSQERMGCEISSISKTLEHVCNPYGQPPVLDDAEGRVSPVDRKQCEENSASGSQKNDNAVQQELESEAKADDGPSGAPESTLQSPLIPKPPTGKPQHRPVIPKLPTNRLTNGGVECLTLKVVPPTPKFVGGIDPPSADVTPAATPVGTPLSTPRGEIQIVDVRSGTAENIDTEQLEDSLNGAYSGLQID